MTMEYMVQWQNLCQVETRKLVLIMGIIATAVLLFQSFTLPYGNIFLSPFPVIKVTVSVKDSSLSEDSSLKPTRVSELRLLSNLAHSRDPLVGVGVVKRRKDFNVKGGVEHETETKEKDRNPETDFSSEKDAGPDKESSLQKAVDLNNNATLKTIRDPYDDFRLERARDIENVFSPERFRKPGNDFVKKPDLGLVMQKIRIPVDFLSPPLTLSSAISSVNGNVLNKLDMNSSNPVMTVALDISSMGKQSTDMLYKGVPPGLLQSGLSTLNSSSTVASNTVIIKKKKKTLPPKPISEMNRILLWSHRVSSRAVRPRWSSKHDQQLLSVKAQIKNAPIVENDRELYSLVFRNVSRFKRSYEMMESIFKVYIYREGEKPIFHQPLLKGIYSSEGWFMKQMEGNRHFIVEDPRKAHMFYLPFSSRFLQNALYVPGSHNRTNLVKYLKNYVDTIAAKYPFWNRTDGSDHFLVACHDWASYETRHNMERSIRALCNTDLSIGFKIGRDVSLPTTYVRFPQNPLKDVGGKPASQRPNLAFFAGNMHGELRTILLQHWGNDPVMKIFGPMTKTKLSYVQFMKTSKYCICPKGYEVNSPRVVEAIFYECVPVIISDNYVLPFFEVLDWEAFSVIVAEKDVPLLKDILLSIPEEKYFAMQLRVKKVQQHFLWHNKPVKYDLFHMILHSIWFNRVHQIKIR